MLFVFYGSDRKTAQRKLSTLLATLQKRRPYASVVKIQNEEIAETDLEILAETQGLFTQKLLITLDCPFEYFNEESFKQLVQKWQESENIFLCLEDTLSSKEKKLYTKYAEKVVESVLPKVADKKEPNIFSITDAFVERDRKNLWVRYHILRLSGFADEQIHGTLLWAVRSALISLEGKRAEDVDLSQFVFQKSKRMAGKYTEEELKTLSRDLVNVYHNARRGAYDMSTGLERFLLQI